MQKIISGSLLSLHYPAALVLVAGEDEEEAISHLLVDHQLGGKGPQDVVPEVGLVLCPHHPHHGLRNENLGGQPPLAWAVSSPERGVVAPSRRAWPPWPSSSRPGPRRSYSAS